MGNGSGVSRGDRNRNARLARLRELVPLGNAIVGIDLADNKQMVVVTDHDSKVLARKTFRCRAWDLGAALDWAAERAAAIQRQRGDYGNEVLSIRAEDLRSLAIIYDTSEKELTQRLVRWQVLAPESVIPDGEPY